MAHIRFDMVWLPLRAMRLLDMSSRGAKGAACALRPLGVKEFPSKSGRVF